MSRNINIEMLVYSGRQNPNFELESESAERVMKLLNEVQTNLTTPYISTSRLGYQGFRIQVTGPILMENGTYRVCSGKVVNEKAGTKVWGISTELERFLVAEASRRGHSELLRELGVVLETEESGR